jgi:cytochrome P450
MDDESVDVQKSAHSDIIATLLRSPHADSFTDEFLEAQAATFLIAGQDTTSVATTWALHLLSSIHRFSQD